MGISHKLYALLLEVSQEASVDILLSALDDMQGYNGQTVTEAIMGAIDADRIEYGWVVPTAAELEERFG
jgi:hypothetical protein